mgnify:CR=1 FL=1
MAKITWKGSALLAPVPPVMVTCGDMENSNIITVAWTGIINSEPPKTYISVRPSRHSYNIIKERGEFVINLTPSRLVRSADWCGVYSGKNVDKFAKCKLTKEQAAYQTYVQDQVSSFGISAAISNEDRQSMLSAVMEDIAYRSNEIVRPAYYESALSLRFMQDPQSRDILGTMFETIAFDYTYATGIGDVRGTNEKKALYEITPDGNGNTGTVVITASGLGAATVTGGKGCRNAFGFPLPCADKFKRADHISHLMM